MCKSRIPEQAELAIAAYQAGDYASALTVLRACADAEERDAAIYLAMMFEAVKGVVADPIEAARWFTVVADAGIALAQFRRGMICYHGIGIEPDPEETKDRFEAAAKKGHLGSKMGMGAILEEHADKVEAAAWLLVAATRGLESSKKMYEHLLPFLIETLMHDAFARSLCDEVVARFGESSAETEGFDETERDARLLQDLKASVSSLREGIASGQVEVLIDPHHLKNYLDRHGYST